MFEKLTKEKKLKAAKASFIDAVAKDRDWQSNARGWFDFRDGSHWSKEEKQVLEEEMRPALTFNVTKSSVDLIMGMNEDNKIRYRVSPTEPGDAFLAELMNDIVDWAYENYDFEDEEADALESAAISGRGYVAVDFLPDPQRFGEIELSVVNVPVSEIHFDPAARRRDLSDASMIYWDRWFPVSDFKMRYPKVTGDTIEEIVKSGQMWGLESGDATGLTVQSPFNMESDIEADDSDYDKPLDMNFYDKSRQMIRVIHMEYWEVYDRYYIWNPVDKEWSEAPEKPTAEIKARFLEEFGQEMAVEVVKDKRVKWLHFTGNQILFDDVSPMPFKGFSIVNMFAFTDISRRTMNHFGIVKGMVDPQKEINKRWSQALNMLNNQVQPGIFAEVDSFVDEVQAKQSMKEAGGITYLNPGVLTGGKIQERDLPSFPNAPMQMEEYSQNILRKITGINPDLLGQDRGRQEPGVVVRLRQQQGITLLKPLFRNFNLLKKRVFKRLISIITEYMPDEQIQRILGQTERYQIAGDGTVQDQMTGAIANLRNIQDLEYNLKAEQQPGNMTMKMLELGTLMEMQQAGIPVPPDQIIEKLELPETDKVRWLNYLDQQSQSQQEEAEKQLQMQYSLEDRKVAVQENKNQIDYILGAAKVAQMENKDDKRLMMDMQQLDLDQRKAVAEHAIQLIQVLAQLNQSDNDVEQEKIQQETEKIKNVQLGIKTMQDVLALEKDKQALKRDIIDANLKTDADVREVSKNLILDELDANAAKNEIAQKAEEIKLDAKAKQSELKAKAKEIDLDKEQVKLDTKRSKMKMQEQKASAKKGEKDGGK